MVLIFSRSSSCLFSVLSLPTSAKLLLKIFQIPHTCGLLFPPSKRKEGSDFFLAVMSPFRGILPFLAWFYVVLVTMEFLEFPVESRGQIEIQAVPGFHEESFDYFLFAFCTATFLLETGSGFSYPDI